jgi:putative flippase GtrA
MVGALNTLFGYLCFATLLFIGLHYAMALFVGTILSVLFNFKTIGSLVFGSPGNCRLIYFVSTYSIVFCINLASLKIFSLFGISPYIGGAALILPMAALSYFLNKKWVFNHD